MRRVITIIRVITYACGIVGLALSMWAKATQGSKGMESPVGLAGLGFLILSGLLFVLSTTVILVANARKKQGVRD